MKILILTNYANGLYLFRKELIENFQKNGHEVFVSVPFDENCVKLKKLGVTLLEAPLERHGMNPAKDFKLFRQYMRTIRRVRPGVVLTYTIKPNIYGALAARIKKVPYICNVTGLGQAIERGGMLSKILLKLYSVSMKKARKVFFQNERNMKFMQDRGVATKNAGLLPGSGVNLIEHPLSEYPSEQAGIHILAVMRVMKDKGVSEYFDMVRELKPEHPNVFFELVGEYEEDERADFEPEINDLVKMNYLKYYGHIDNVPDVMAASHIVVHPSYHEGLSNVLLEAAACGRPVLATDVNGCKETVDVGKSGYLFEARNSKSLIEAVERILSLTENQRKEMGLAGRRWVENHFDRNIVIDAYDKEIERK